MNARRVPDAEIVPAFVSGSADPDVSLDLTPGSSAPAVFRDSSLTEDPYFVPAHSRMHDSVRDSLLGVGAGRVVRNAFSEPGRSEFSFGRGQMAPLELADPSQADVMHAVYRTDPADPAAEVDYSTEIRESPEL